MIDVKIDSHAEEIAQLTDEAIGRILWQMGAKAEGFAKDETPVDTGRLRNSITFVTKDQEGKIVEFEYTEKENGEKVTKKGSYNVGAGLEGDTVAIGTNVEYAEDVELGGMGRSGKHMLERAVSEHGDIYEKIIKNELEAVKT